MADLKPFDERLFRMSQAIIFPTYGELPGGTKYFLEASKPYRVKGKEETKVLPGTRVIVLQKDLEEAQKPQPFKFKDYDYDH